MTKLELDYMYAMSFFRPAKMIVDGRARFQPKPKKKKPKKRKVKQTKAFERAKVIQ